MKRNPDNNWFIIPHRNGSKWFFINKLLNICEIVTIALIPQQFIDWKGKLAPKTTTLNLLESRK